MIHACAPHAAASSFLELDNGSEVDWNATVIVQSGIRLSISGEVSMLAPPS